MKKKEDILGEKIAVYIVASVLTGLVYKWANWALVKWNISWWQWTVIGFAVGLSVWFRPVKVLNSIILIATFIVTVLYWLNIITLPLFKH